MNLRNTWLVAMVSLSLAACNGRGDDDPAEGDADTDADADTDTDPEGFTLSGSAFDLSDGVTPAAEGLCVVILDPEPALSGGDPVSLGEGAVGAAGAFSVENLVVDQALGAGLLVSIEDCDPAAGTVIATATGVPSGDYEGLTTGDELTGMTAFVITSAFEAGIEGSLDAAGYTGAAVAETGMLLGFALDNTGAPLDGVTVTCDSDLCDGIGSYYLDEDPTDGMFTSATTGLNTSTMAAVGGLWFIPAAPITSYAIEDGGAHVFEDPADPLDNIFGSQTGYAVVIAVTAD